MVPSREGGEVAHTLDLLALLDLTGRERSGGSTRGPVVLASPIKHDDVEHHRNLSCAEYDLCLEVALRRGWPSWSCRRYPLFLRGGRRTRRRSITMRRCGRWRSAVRDPFGVRTGPASNEPEPRRAGAWNGGTGTYGNGAGQSPT